MKTKVICHMAVSIDGKIILDNWQPQDTVPSEVFEKIYNDIDAEAWIIGRVSAEFYASKTEHNVQTDVRYPRTSWYAKPLSGCPCIVLDSQGKLSWDSALAEGNSVIVVLNENVSDSVIARLRKSNISYIFGGESKTDLTRVLKTLSTELGLTRIMLQGGAKTNGMFLEQGLIDELSIIVTPVIDGCAVNPGLINVNKFGLYHLNTIKLVDMSVLDGGNVWLRYSVSYTSL